MKTAGFAVQLTGVNDTTAARKRLDMPDSLGACQYGNR